MNRTDDECYTGTGPAVEVVGQAGMSDTQEREAHVETNRAMTDALLMMEEREQRDEALLREALYALEYASDMTEPEDLQWCECPICTSIAALRERLSKGA